MDFVQIVKRYFLLILLSSCSNSDNILENRNFNKGNWLLVNVNYANKTLELIDDKSICICIPARYNSQRFPGKPLALIGETPMVIRVAQNMKNSKLADHVVILTDDERIKEVSENYQC